MFDDLPLSFQAELSLVVNRKVLDKVKIWNHTYMVSRSFFYLSKQLPLY